MQTMIWIINRFRLRSKIVKENDLGPFNQEDRFKDCGHKLSIGKEGLTFYDERVLIPKKSRPAILKSLHIANHGIRKTRNLLSQFNYRPKMMNESEQMINHCEECNRVRPSKRNEPLIKRRRLSMKLRLIFANMLEKIYHIC